MLALASNKLVKNSSSNASMCVAVLVTFGVLIYSFFTYLTERLEVGYVNVSTFKMVEPP